MKEPGFESNLFEGKSSWNFSPNFIPIWDTTAHEGRHSLYVTARSEGGAVVDQSVSGTVPGHSYLFTCWVMRCVIDEGNYPVFRILGHEVEANDLWARNRWQKFTLLVPRAGTESDIRIKVQEAAAGGYLFDDIALVEFHVEPTMPVDGERRSDPSFDWIATETDRIISYSLELSRTAGFEQPIAEHVTDADDCPYRSASAIPAGDYFWRVRAYHGREEVAVSATRSFHLLTPWPGTGRAVPTAAGRWPDAFVPLGIYVSENDLPLLHGTGLDTVILSSRLLPAADTALDECRANNLSALIPAPSADADLTDWAGLAARHPELRGWYLADEPEGHLTPPIGLMRQRIKLGESTPGLPAAMALLRPWRVADYGAAAEFIMVDPYPVPFFPLALMGRCIDTARTEAGPDKRVWAVIQAFNWSEAYVGPDPAIVGRPPTEPEIRALAYLSLIHGARGIFFFSLPQARRSGTWDAVKRVAAEIAEVLPVFESGTLSPGHGVACEAGDGYGGPAVHATRIDLPRAIGRTNPARHWVVAVNTTPSRVRATFALPALTEGGERWTAHDFEPFEVRLLRVDPLP